MRANLSAMISSEVQRTLVKSPPELWAELSDPAALARHLGELGEIRIVRTEPESTVEWAAQNTTGTVSIKPSGWGTKVTLSVTRESAEPGHVDTAEPEPMVVDVEPESRIGGSAVEPTHEMKTEPAPETESRPALEAEPQPALETELQPVSETETAPQPAPRRGFFARLFGRRRAAPQETPSPVLDASFEQESPTALGQGVEHRAPGQPDAFAAVRQALEPEAFAEAHPFAVVAAPATPLAGDDAAADVSAELMAAESVAADEVSAEEVTAVLTAVLDRLGAAHHRPFSRS